MTYIIVKAWSQVIASDTPPTLTVEGPDSYLLQVGDTFTMPKASATDTFGRSIGHRIDIESNVNPRLVGTYTVTFTIRDTYGNQTSKTITVRYKARNTPPVIDAGPDLTDILINTAVPMQPTFADADNDELTWQWTVEGPPGSNPKILNADRANAKLVPDVSGLFTMTAVAYDGFDYSFPSSMTVSTFRIEPKPRLYFEHNEKIAGWREQRYL